MITEQEAREAALQESLARIGDYKRGIVVPRYADKAVVTLPVMLLEDLCTITECYQQELARREAERVERAKPIDAEWCRTHGGQGSDDQMSWQVTGGEWVRVTLYRPHGSSVTFMGRKLYDIQTVGDLSDLLAALKGGA